VNEILKLPPSSGKIIGIADFDIQTKLNALSEASTEEQFAKSVEDFPERFNCGVTKAVMHLCDKEFIIQAIINHCTISACWEEIQKFTRGLSTLGVSFFCFFIRA